MKTNNFHKAKSKPPKLVPIFTAIINKTSQMLKLITRPKETTKFNFKNKWGKSLPKDLPINLIKNNN